MHNKNRSMKYLSLLILFSILLSACVGSGGRDGSSGGGNTTVPPNEDVNGIWEGTISQNGVGTFDLEGILYEGRIIAISREIGAIYEGTYSVTSDAITGNVTIHEDNFGTVARTATLTGVVNAQSQISLTFQDSGGGTGSITLLYDDIYERNSALSTIAGSYATPSGFRSLEILPNGSVSGSTNTGCTLDGDISILDSNFGLYALNLNFSSCDERNGFHSGFASLFDNLGVNDRISLTYTSGSRVVVGSSYRRTTVPPNEDANGIWEGTISQNGVGTFGLKALLHEGVVIATSQGTGFLYEGTYSVTSDIISGNVTIYAHDESSPGPVLLSGVVNAQSQLSLTFTDLLGGVGTISLLYDDIYERNSSLSTIAGSYASPVSPRSVEVLPNGSINGTSGTLSGGECILSGEISILDPNFGLYGLNVERSCGSGSYIRNFSGFASLFDDLGVNDVLKLTFVDEGAGSIISYRRQ